ncbi:MAG: T9SS type A sorting domain-containing protein [Saprospiraceae bacterium]|nr:T9SS type A sorting domain-containing protein [Saprospiraceae bacterium]MCB9318907.1 T9SS type A sorting domain-containing protein [Lewinellaceae bacterium]
MKQVLKLIALICLVSSALRSQEVPDFVLHDSEGNTHQLSAYLQNNQYVVLEFFHSLATQANSMAYDLEQLYEVWGNGEFKVQFLAVSLRDFDDNATLNKFKVKYRASFPHCGVDGGALTNMTPWTDGIYGQIRLLPSFVIISPDSTVVFDIRDNNTLALLDSIDHTLYRLGARKPFIVKGQVTMDDSPMQEVQVEADDEMTHNNRVVLTNLEGKYIHVFDSTPSDRSILFRPIKNDRHDNGVSTWDIVFTIKHILGQEPFTTIEELIAADINHDERISAIDVVEMRKMVLGIDTVFKNNTSWRFIPKNYQYPTVDSLFLLGFPEAITIGEILDQPDNASFIGIKVGDVNGSAEVNLLESRNEHPSAAPLYYAFRENDGGQRILRITLPAESSQWVGMQLGLQLPGQPLKITTNLSHWEDGLSFYDHKSGEWRLSYPYSTELMNEPAYIDLTLDQEQLTINLASKFHSEVYTNTHQVKDIKLDPLMIDGGVRTYPNPTNDDLAIVIPAGWNEGQIDVLDLQGKLWIRKAVSGRETTSRISMAHLPAGIYVIRCQDQLGHRETVRVLKD